MLQLPWLGRYTWGEVLVLVPSAGFMAGARGMEAVHPISAKAVVLLLATSFNSCRLWASLTLIQAGKFNILVHGIKYCALMIYCHKIKPVFISEWWDIPIHNWMGDARICLLVFICTSTVYILSIQYFTLFVIGKYVSLGVPFPLIIYSLCFKICCEYCRFYSHTNCYSFYSGRKITSSGRRDLDQVAGRIVVVAPW